MARLASRSAGTAPRSFDVTRVAGVSQKTVSRVMNGKEHVFGEVRRRVLGGAEGRGYRLNHADRTQASGRTWSVGVVRLRTGLYSPAAQLTRVEGALREVGYALFGLNTTEGDAAGIASADGSLLDQGVDGIVISEPTDEKGGQDAWRSSRCRAGGRLIASGGCLQRGGQDEETRVRL
ncbi:hypothetical protein C6376_40805 [Streptomyces sp. P3]|uniref:LacI family DNA-binding transcriptional regulator n=1 Tax=unclassified Streptomyces TaxID=2593676 RepID=UPI000D1BAAC5|nr:LacI family DNA-binding transcriptional regulator [Streptomyces sp. ID05-04B]AVV46741.1 hypothetical protein C6376_40805 [Streptomyces sp. P3]